jgi:hypothetical protein
VARIGEHRWTPKGTLHENEIQQLGQAYFYTNAYNFNNLEKHEPGHS